MTVKEFLMQRLRLFLFLTVMILIAQSVVGTIAAPGVSLHIRYIDLLSPLYMAGLCILPTVVTFSRKRLSVRQVLIRRSIQLALIEGVIMAIVFTSDKIDSSRPSVVALIAGATLLIYALAVLFVWFGQRSESQRMTAQLRRLQEKAQAGQNPTPVKKP